MTQPLLSIRNLRVRDGLAGGPGCLGQVLLPPAAGVLGRPAVPLGRGPQSRDEVLGGMETPRAGGVLCGPVSPGAMVTPVESKAVSGGAGSCWGRPGIALKKVSPADRA